MCPPGHANVTVATTSNEPAAKPLEEAGSRVQGGVVLRRASVARKESRVRRVCSNEADKAHVQGKVCITDDNVFQCPGGYS